MTKQTPLSPTQARILALARRQRAQLSPTPQSCDQILQRVLAEQRGEHFPEQPQEQLHGSGVAAEAAAVTRLGARRVKGIRRGFLPLMVAATILLAWGLNLFESSPEPMVNQRAIDSLERHPLFRGTALVSPEPASRFRGAGLLRGLPFEEKSAFWQVRSWNDLGHDPEGDVPFEFHEGALCMVLKDGERVLGGWPWVEGESASKTTVLAVLPAVLPTVSLKKGQAYRLTFEAWSSAPTASRLLVAVGHATPPYSTATGARVAWTTEVKTYTLPFVAQFDDPAAGIAFIARARGLKKTARVCMRNWRLENWRLEN